MKHCEQEQSWTPAFWHRKAKEARNLADESLDEDARVALQNVADLCEAMAVRTEERASQRAVN